MTTERPMIEKCFAREILDSRGIPTVEAVVRLTDGTVGIASVPSGASTGKYEAYEKRDNDPTRFHGKGVLEAVSSIEKVISPALSGAVASEPYRVDRMLLSLDGSREKGILGANATLAVSLASARAVASHYGLPLYRYLGGSNADHLPIPMMNLLNGGAHANNNLEIQEFMIVPVGAERFEEAVMIGCTVYQTLKKILVSRGYPTAVGDEGGFAPSLSSDEEACELLLEAIKQSGYDESVVKLAVDAATSSWALSENEYRLPKTGITFTRDELITYWERFTEKYPILSLEDGLGEEDFAGWQSLTKKIGNRTLLVGDDLFATNTARLWEGIHGRYANTVLVKPNQVGTLTEAVEFVKTAKDAGYTVILSHRSGETEDSSIADLAVAVGAPYLKAGAPCRGERTAKYNRLLRIASALGGGAVYGMQKHTAKETEKEELLYF